MNLGLQTANELGLPDGINNLDIKGWNSDAEIFPQLINEVKPSLIIEVGTWKGASAIHMASLVQALNLNTKIICVDTWLGALEMWTDKEDEDRYSALKLKNGYPTIYYQFLYNVIEAGFGDIIVPFPQTSSIAARYFEKMNIKADLIYIDASHDRNDVRDDIVAYSTILNDGGIMFGDDYHTWQDVREAVDSITYNNTVVIGNHWVIKK